MKIPYITIVIGTFFGTALSQSCLGWEGNVIPWFISWILSIIVATVIFKIFSKTKQ